MLPFRYTLPHRVISIVRVLALESGFFILFVFFFTSPSPGFLTRTSVAGGNGLTGLIFTGRSIRPSGVTVHPALRATFSGVMRDISGACTPRARALRFLFGGFVEAGGIRGQFYIMLLAKFVKDYEGCNTPFCKIGLSLPDL
jgi:hypothetical protein